MFLFRSQSERRSKSSAKKDTSRMSLIQSDDGFTDGVIVTSASFSSYGSPSSDQSPDSSYTNRLIFSHHKSTHHRRARSEATRRHPVSLIPSTKLRSCDPLRRAILEEPRLEYLHAPGPSTLRQIYRKDNPLTGAEEDHLELARPASSHSRQRDQNFDPSATKITTAGKECKPPVERKNPFRRIARSCVADLSSPISLELTILGAEALGPMSLVVGQNATVLEVIGRALWTIWEGDWVREQGISSGSTLQRLRRGTGESDLPAISNGWSLRRVDLNGMIDHEIVPNWPDKVEPLVASGSRFVLLRLPSFTPTPFHSLKNSSERRHSEMPGVPRPHNLQVAIAGDSFDTTVHTMGSVPATTSTEVLLDQICQERHLDVDSYTILVSGTDQGQPSVWHQFPCDGESPTYLDGRTEILLVKKRL